MLSLMGRLVFSLVALLAMSVLTAMAWDNSDNFQASQSLEKVAANHANASSDQH